MSKPLATQLEEFIDTLGLKHFQGRELTCYWSQVRRGVRNSVPPRNLWPNIVPTLRVLDRLRAELDAPIILTSTYRSPAYNRAVGGARFSQHLLFNACDFQCRQWPPSHVADVLRDLRGCRFTDPTTGKRFVFRGGIGEYNTFVHLDTRGHDADW